MRKPGMLRIMIVFTMLFLPVSIPAEEEAGPRDYPSPDGKYHALVVPLPGAPSGSGESKVEIRAARNDLLYSQSFRSDGGEHGFGVERAAWSPDSKFFVYSVSSSGGHQAWHFPIFFVSVRDFTTRKLDDYLAPITSPDFTMTPPDIIRVVGRKPDQERESTYQVRLSDLTGR